MNNLLKDQTYLQILEEAKNFHNIPKGLSSENSVSKTNLTLVKKINIIILLLINISQKLSRIYNKPSSSNTQDIEDLSRPRSRSDPIGESKPVSGCETIYWDSLFFFFFFELISVV